MEGIPTFDNAACLGEDPEIFFPVGYIDDKSRKQIETAKNICHRCLDQTDCFDYAIRTRQTDGIWGGTTPDERKSVQKRRLKLAMSHGQSMRSMDREAGLDLVGTRETTENPYV